MNKARSSEHFIYEPTAIDSKRAFSQKAALYDINLDLKLCGSQGNFPLDVSDELLAYIWSLLKNETPLRTEAPISQWSELLTMLLPHWILPLLYWRISSLSKDLHPPESIVHQMRMAFLTSRVRCLFMERQLGQILQAFQTGGVRTLILRGPALAWLLYPDPALRPSSDLDLLVLPEQMIQARAILEGLGYKCLSKRFEVAREFFREEDFIHMKNPRDNVLVDLHWVHWELHPFFGSSHDIGIEDLFVRARKIELQSLKFETLHPVDDLIHAAIHLVMIHSRDMRFIWINDIALLARHLHTPEDWELLRERCVAWRARLAVENSLKMAQFWCGLKVPDGFAEFSNWPRASADEHSTWSHVVGDHWVTALLKRYLFKPSGILIITRSLFHLLFPPPEIVRYCYPPPRDWLLPLSYIRRWLRWFRELIVNRISASRNENRS